MTFLEGTPQARLETFGHMGCRRQWQSRGGCGLGGCCLGPYRVYPALLPKHSTPSHLCREGSPRAAPGQDGRVARSCELNPWSHGSLCRTGVPEWNVVSALCEALLWRNNCLIPGPAFHPPWSFARAESLGVSNSCSYTGMSKFNGSIDHKALQLGAFGGSG